jgi:diguanylate cyclase (GGDEF)-like protein
MIMVEKLIISTSSYLPSPLSPILPWCRDKLKEKKDLSLEKKLEEWGLSPSHRPLFISYCQNEIPHRVEEFSFSEKEYERRLIYQNLWIIFSSLIHEEGHVNEIILNIEGKYAHNTRKFMAFLEEQAKDIPQEIIINFPGHIIGWDGLSHLPAYQFDNRLDDKDLYRKAMTFHAFGDHLICCQICEGLYQKARAGTLNFDIQQRAFLFMAYGKSALHLQLADMALTIFNSLMNLGKAWGNREYTAEAYRLTGLVYHRNGYNRAAIRFLRKSLDESEKSDPSIHRFQTLFSLIQLEGPDTLTQEEEDEALELVKKWKMENSEATLQIYRKDPDFNRIFEILETSEDALLLSETYYRRAMLAIDLGSGEAEEDLKKSLKIGQELNNPRIINRAHSSLGYYYLITGDYKTCFYQYRKALEGYLKAESYEDMARVYFQLALLALLVFRPGTCISYLNSSQYILGKLIRSLPEFEEQNRFLTYFVQIQDTGELPATPIKKVKNGSNVIFSEIGSFFERIKYESEECILSRLDKWSLRIPYGGWKLCFLLLAVRSRTGCNNNKLIKKLKKLPSSKGEMAVIVDMVIRGESNFPSRCRWLKEPIDKELVTASLKQYRRLEQLKRKMHEINLLSAIQTIFSQRSEREILLLQTMERLLTSFLVNIIYYYEKMEDSYRLAYYSSTFDERPDRSLLNDYLADSDNSHRPKMLRGFLCIPVMTDSRLEGILIGKMEESSLNSEENDIQFFSILSSQLGSALGQIRQRELIVMKNRQLEEINRKLTKTTLTDPLTGIGNRMQLNVKMKEFDKRYGGSREGDNFCLMFIDLDFFKVYNDTYGHALGDRLLGRFTELMKAACRESDGIFRYGGDEFILLLGGVNSENALPIANRLLESLKEQKGFTELLEEEGYESPHQDKWLSCSIGISDFIRAGGKLDELLEQADKAVYQAKEQGKRRWVIYNKGEKSE